MKRITLNNMTATKTINNYTASTILNYSPQKTRLIINEIRGLALDKAILTLKSMQKPKAKKIYQLLKSGASNLKLVEGDYSDYSVVAIVAEEAQRLYRSMPRARGSAFKIRRRYARIRVELAVPGISPANLKKEAKKIAKNISKNDTGLDKTIKIEN